MSFQLLEQDMANAIGFVFDRSVNPPALLGQGFLVSKSRFVCCSGKVFHYTEAPWALELHFVHPDIRMGVKSVNIHPDFDKPLARNDYLSQNGRPGETLPILPNDMAMLIVDPEPVELMPERVGEIVRAMSLPFNNRGVEMSGPVKGHEYLQVLNNLLAQGKQGLMTLFDIHNIPIARMQIGQNSIPLVYSSQFSMPPAYAFFELAIRQPAAGFAFEPQGDFPWPDMTPVNAPADRFIWEAMRRANELDQLYSQLGGHAGRYQRVVQTYDPSSSSEEIRWMVQNLWDALDGYLTLDKLSQRSGADSYTCMVAVRELVNRGVASQINRHSPFHGNGTVGPPLISHTDFEVHNWDNLQAFYLDPLSGKPCWVQGNYFGSASAVQPKNMLHTIPVPPEVSGALICKDYKLIGLHNGPQALRGGVTAPPMKCSQFMWMGALLDVSSKRGKLGADSEEGSVSSLKSRLDTEAQEAVAEEDRIVCPVCFSPNHAYGPCGNCGHILEAPPEEPEAKTVKDKAGKAVKKLQKKAGLTNKQAAIAAAILLPLTLITVMSMFKPAAPPPPSDNVQLPGQYKTHDNNEAAKKLAVEEAGFKVQPVGDYWYEDTTEITKPNPSFGVYSERTNQKIIFVVQNDMSAYANLKAFEKKPPFVDDFYFHEGAPSETGKQVLGEDTLNWMILNGNDGKGNAMKILLAAFPGLKEGTSILVTGQPLTKEGRGVSYDPTIAINVIDQMAEERTQRANQAKRDGKLPEPTDDEDTADEQQDLASDEDITKFLTSAKTTIQSNLTLPEWAQEEMTKDKSERRKIRTKLKVGIDQEGNVKSLEKLDQDSDEDQEKLSSALQTAVTKSAPFKLMPKIKEPQLKFLVKLSGNKIKVERATTSTTL